MLKNTKNDSNLFATFRKFGLSIPSCLWKHLLLVHHLSNLKQLYQISLLSGACGLRLGNAKGARFTQLHIPQSLNHNVCNNSCVNSRK